MKNHTHNLTTERKPTAAERLEMVERYRRSGQTRRGFCESERVAKSTLDWWLRKSKGPRSRKKRVAFREVALVSTDVGAGNWVMEVVSPQGWTIRSRQTLSVEQMARLLREPRC